MDPITPPPSPPGSKNERSLATEAAVSLLTTVSLVAGILGAATVANALPWPSPVLVPVALLVGFGLALAIPLATSRVGRLLLARLEQPTRDVPRADDDPPERLDRRRFDGLDHGHLGGPDR